MESQVIILPDGSVAVLSRTMTWGDIVIILLLVALLFLELYKLWRTRSW